MSSSVNLQDFRIPLEELKRATDNFNYDSAVSDDDSYQGELSEHWQNRRAFIKRYNKEEYESHELVIVSRLDHEDIISFIGFCDEDDNYIYMAYEYFAHKSLDDILKTNTAFDFSWSSRLKICIRVAKVLNYLHLGLGEHGRVIHGYVKCENILLNTSSFEPIIKVSGFKHSKLVPLNQPHQHHYCPEELFREPRTDPIYKETNLLNTESDIYSFGVLMFEILHGYGTNKENLHQLINLVRRCYDDGPYKLVDPDLREDINHRSIQIFTTLAYKCISFDIKERPRMDEIIKTIQKVLDIFNDGSTLNKKDGSTLNKLIRTIKKFEIPLEEIRKIIDAIDFDRRDQEGHRYRRMTHRGKIVYCGNEHQVFIKLWTSEESFDDLELKRILNELLLISSFCHENITPLIGYNDSKNHVIILSDYAVNGSLYLKLETQNENGYLTWAERLKICFGAARGLKCYHAGFGEQKVIHGDFKSEKILLYNNLEAKICGFGKSFQVPRSHPDTNVYKEAHGSKYYMDPVYCESLIPRVESNVYSFGVVLFEVLTGILACTHPPEDERISMITWVRHYKDEIEKLIDYRIRDEIDARSLHIFKQLAYKCISFNMKDRPSMNQVVKRLAEALYIQTHGAASTVARKYQKLEDFRIPLKDINLAIEAKGQETLGEGGFGVVYKGQLSEHWQNRTVAIKYQYPKSGHEERMFRNELNMTFSFSHENIIPFIGYCEEGEEKIIVYEFASNGSLDCHLEDEDKRCDLTWERRLKICLGVASGLEYLHSGRGEDEDSVIHRDVKSGNILLDDNLVAKICDFGLSKAGPLDKLQTEVYTNTAGTDFYRDPVYHESGILHKVSDVYSFGVVMFELLSGLPVYYRRSIGDSKDKLLLHLVRRYYDHKPELLIDHLIEDEIDNRSFNVYREVAYQCISFNSKERPTMEMIVNRVEEALELQVTNQGDLKQKVTKS